MSSLLGRPALLPAGYAQTQTTQVFGLRPNTPKKFPLPFSRQNRGEQDWG